MGGCVSSKQHHLTENHRSLSLPVLLHTTHEGSSSSETNLDNATCSFVVSTVNSKGKPITGNLEISQNELILRPSRGAPIRWPLSYLRRYGYDEGVFSIESGRRCTSGPGVFTFASDQAEQLFQTVQRRIEEASTTALHCSTLPLVLHRNTNNTLDRNTQNDNLPCNSALLMTELGNNVNDLLGDDEERHHEMVQIGHIGPINAGTNVHNLPSSSTNKQQQHCYVNVGVNQSIVPDKQLINFLNNNNNHIDTSKATATNASLMASLLNRRFSNYRRQSHSGSAGIRPTHSLNDATTTQQLGCNTDYMNVLKDQGNLCRNRSQRNSMTTPSISLTPSTTSTIVDYVTLNLRSKHKRGSQKAAPQGVISENIPTTLSAQAFRPTRTQSDSDAQLAMQNEIDNRLNTDMETNQNAADSSQLDVDNPRAPYAIIDGARTKAMLSLTRTNKSRYRHRSDRSLTAAM